MDIKQKGKIVQMLILKKHRRKSQKKRTDRNQNSKGSLFFEHLQRDHGIYPLNVDPIRIDRVEYVWDWSSYSISIFFSNDSMVP